MANLNDRTEEDQLVLNTDKDFEPETKTVEVPVHDNSKNVIKTEEVTVVQSMPNHRGQSFNSYVVPVINAETSDEEEKQADETALHSIKINGNPLEKGDK